VLGATEDVLGDLDGDGAPELMVSFPASYTERGLLILKPVPYPVCFQVLYDGVGEGVGIRRSFSKGHADLSIFFRPITSNGRGTALAVARFHDGSYRLSGVERCAGIDGKHLPQSECQRVLRSYLVGKAP
jgi:hypothetical protein